jgi:hypothetical protein
MLQILATALGQSRSTLERLQVRRSRGRSSSSSSCLHRVCLQLPCSASAAIVVHQCRIRVRTTHHPKHGKKRKLLLVARTTRLIPDNLLTVQCPAAACLPACLRAVFPQAEEAEIENLIQKEQKQVERLEWLLETVQKDYAYFNYLQERFEAESRPGGQQEQQQSRW